MISASASGDWSKTENWLKQMADGHIFDQLSSFAQEGLTALAAATPVESGITANSWTAEILKEGSTWSIVWGNTHIEDGRPIAILLQYGHGTGTGGYVQGRDYINPALAPVFDRIAEAAWKVVTA